MNTFYEYISESNVSQLKHLVHIEEAILHLGFDGARESIEILRSIRDTLSGNGEKSYNHSSKYDGAPSLIFGIDPEDGQFFVGTKGVFSKTKKLVKTKQDLDTYGYQGELRNKLEIALKYLPKLNVKGVVQGDMMFTSSDLKREKIKDTEYITFTPNTITYAVPTKLPLAKEILRAKIGIVLHTTYVGTGPLENLTATPGQIDISDFSKTPDVWFDDPYVKDVSGTLTMTKSETIEVTRYISEAGKLLQQISKKDLLSLFSHFDQLPKSAVGMRVDTFINSLIRTGRNIEPGKGRYYAGTYQDYLREYWENKIVSKIKTEKTKIEKWNFFNEWIKDVSFNTVANMLDFMAYIAKAKDLLLTKLSQGAESLQTFVATDKGYRVTSGEGFVISDKISGNVYKIVDRAEFSRLNFSNTAKFGTRG